MGIVQRANNDGLFVINYKCFTGILMHMKPNIYYSWIMRMS